MSDRQSPPSEGQDPLVGTTFEERFRLDATLGKGGFGAVYKAFQLGIGRPVALKVLDQRLAGDVHHVARFQQEARALAALDHPGVVHVYDFGQSADGQLYLVMELVAGRPLSDVLRQEAPLAPDRVVALADQLLDALAEAHRVGIVHRDLKPDNILLLEGGHRGERAKLIDFGIAKVTGDEAAPMTLTQTGAVIGSPAYMSPEQCRGLPLTGASDLYSLGVVLYEMLTGRPVFVRPTAPAYLMAHAYEPPTRPVVRFRNLEGPLVDLVMRMLAKEPADRPAGALAALDALRALGPEPARVAQGPSVDDPTATHGGVQAPPASGLAEGSDAATAPTGDLASLPSSEAAPVPPADEATDPRRADGPRRRWGPLGLAGVAVAAAAAWLLGTPSHEPPGRDRVDAAAAAPDLAAALRALASESAPTLLVAPFEHAAERTADRVLWPLADRMVFNALRTDEVLLGRVSRVDPLRVAEEREARELPYPLNQNTVDELARAMGADLVLVGAVERDGGQTVLHASLRRAGETEGLGLEGRGATVATAAANLADSLRAALWDAPDRAPKPPRERLEALLLDREATAVALLDVRPGMDTAARRALYERLLEADRTSFGPAWMRLLESVWVKPWRDEVIRRAEGAGDAALGQLVASLTVGPGGPEPCAGIDVGAVGARHPLLIGRTAEVVCHHARGDLEQAVRVALWIHRADPVLRPTVRWFLSSYLQQVMATEEELPIRREMQELGPEHAAGWSKLAIWYARSGGEGVAKALELLAVARSLLTDRAARRLVGYHGAQVHLLALDVEGAADWFAMMEASTEPGAVHSDDALLQALRLQMGGRFGASAETTRVALAATTGNAYALLALSLFYAELAAGRPDAAEAVLVPYAERFSGPGKALDAYGIDMMRLALRHARGGLRPAAVVRAMEKAGEAIVASHGDRGWTEREAHECFLALQLDDRGGAARLVRARPASKYLGGCRVLLGETLLERGAFARAAEQLHEGLTDMVTLRLDTHRTIPRAMLALARARAGEGDRAGAVALLERLTRSHARADARVPAVQEGYAELARLRTGGEE